MQNPTPGDTDVFATTNIESFRTELRVAGHEMIADEPASLGGGGEGPSPYDLLSAGLASCTSMTLKMYAARKGLDLRSISVRVRHGKIHADDCSDCETKAGRIDTFEREIAFDGELTNAEIERLLQIADMCPVHRTLHAEVRIRTTLAA